MVGWAISLMMEDVERQRRRWGEKERREERHEKESREQSEKEEEKSIKGPEREKEAEEKKTKNFPAVEVGSGRYRAQLSDSVQTQRAETR